MVGLPSREIKAFKFYSQPTALTGRHVKVDEFTTANELAAQTGLQTLARWGKAGGSDSPPLSPDTQHWV